MEEERFREFKKGMEIQNHMPAEDTKENKSIGSANIIIDFWG